MLLALRNQHVHKTTAQEMLSAIGRLTQIRPAAYAAFLQLNYASKRSWCVTANHLDAKVSENPDEIITEGRALP